MNSVNVIYRLSDNGYAKVKFPNATKQHCLENCIEHFGADNITILLDMTNLIPETEKFVDSLKLRRVVKHTMGSSAASSRTAMGYACTYFDDDDIVYLLEDDYLHLSGSVNAIVEGLEIADYVSLYDHNDKYIPAQEGGNPFIDIDGGEVTKVFRTKSHHWKLTNSTTMTFATTVGQLKKDDKIWTPHIQSTHPNDFQAFLDLRGAGRSLITPLPGLSTHCEPKWASPGTDWSQV